MFGRKTTPEEAEARRLSALADAAEAQARMERAHADKAHAHGEAEKAHAAAERRRLRTELELEPLRDAHREMEVKRTREQQAHAEQRRAHRRRLLRTGREALQGRTFVTCAFIGVNGIAVEAQAHAFGGGMEGWLKAGVLECVALAVGWIGHQALKRGRPAKGKRFASYAIAALMAGINYSHFSDGLQPSFQAVAYAFCSLVSPWLWGMYSRHLHADTLDAAGLLSKGAPDFPPLRWVFWFKQTLGAYRWGVREGVSDWRTCVRGWKLEQEETRTAAEAEAERTRITADHVRAGFEWERTRALLAEVREDLVRTYGHVLAADRIADALLGAPAGARSIEGAHGDPERAHGDEQRAHGDLERAHGDQRHAHGDSGSGRTGAHGDAGKANLDAHDAHRLPHNPDDPSEENPHINNPHEENEGEPDDDDRLPELPGLPTADELKGMDDRTKLMRARITVYLARQQGINLRGRGAELARAYEMKTRWGQYRVKEETLPFFSLRGEVVSDDEEPDSEQLDSDDNDDNGAASHEAAR